MTSYSNAFSRLNRLLKIWMLFTKRLRSFSFTCSDTKAPGVQTDKILTTRKVAFSLIICVISEDLQKYLNISLKSVKHSKTQPARLDGKLVQRDWIVTSVIQPLSDSTIQTSTRESIAIVKDATSLRSAPSTILNKTEVMPTKCVKITESPWWEKRIILISNWLIKQYTITTIQLRLPSSIQIKSRLIKTIFQCHSSIPSLKTPSN